MTRRHYTSLLLAACAALSGQNAQLGQKDAPIRVDVNLVQVDAVVTDSKNRHVPDLKASDFQVFEDGKLQPITNFAYIAPPAGTPASTSPAPAPRAPLVPAPPVPSKPEAVRRTIAFVVDDLGLSVESIAHVRDALRKFVNGEMQPGDLVAILRTSGGMGVLQPFTGNRELLNAAIDRVRFSIGRVGVDSFAPATPPPPHELQRQADTSMDDLRTQVFMAGTLGTLRYVIDGLRDMPGRKSLVLFSESLSTNVEPGQTPYTDLFHRLTDAANRASVVINAIDPRGLQTMMDARDSELPSGRGGGRGMGALILQRAGEMFDSQAGLAVLARDTGGLFITNNNLVDDALDQVVADTEGYYLIGYQPGAASFASLRDEPAYHKVEVRVKIRGLSVRSRSGFFGESHPERDHAPRTAQAALLNALASPFAAAGVHVRLTTMFTQTEDRQSRLSELLYIDPRDLAFTPQPDGSARVAFEIAAVTLGVKGDRLNESDRTFTVDLKPDQIQETLRTGMVYVVNQPVKNAGFYQVRVALLDQNSDRTGSANELVNVPDLAKGKLALSSILLRKDAPAGISAVDHAEGQVGASDPAIAEATRVFKAGDALSYQYLLFNAKTSEGKSSLEVETRLFRDGKQVYAGQPMVPELAGDAAAGRLLAGGRINLSQAIPPGGYVLQLIVTDRLAKGKSRTASQWVDFEIQR